eukprot:350853-Prorocentrum_minimum.AAC.3
MQLLDHRLTCRDFNSSEWPTLNQNILELRNILAFDFDPKCTGSSIFAPCTSSIFAPYVLFLRQTKRQNVSTSSLEKHLEAIPIDSKFHTSDTQVEVAFCSSLVSLVLSCLLQNIRRPRRVLLRRCEDVVGREQVDVPRLRCDSRGGGDRHDAVRVQLIAGADRSHDSSAGCPALICWVCVLSGVVLFRSSFGAPSVGVSKDPCALLAIRALSEFRVCHTMRITKRTL